MKRVKFFANFAKVASMQKQAYFIGAKDEMKKIEPKNGSDFSLEEMYNLIGCELVEVVYLPENMLMIVDEEGLLKDQPTFNHIANSIANEMTEGLYDDPNFKFCLAGNVLLIHDSQLK